jgi:transposase
VVDDQQVPELGGSEVPGQREQPLLYDVAVTRRENLKKSPHRVRTVYRTLDSRSKEAAMTLLGDFSGTLIVDGLASYSAAAKGDTDNLHRFKIANCHAHARRRFVDCEQSWPAESACVIGLYQQLYEIERIGKEPGIDLLTLRQTQSKPLIDQLYTWAREQQARQDIPNASTLAKALTYLLNQEPGLRVYLDDPAVNIDNNTAERAMRTPVLGRENFYGSRSRRGAENAAIFYTLIDAAKRAGVSPQAYLVAAVEYALTKNGETLLPAEFKSQLDAVRDPPITA